MKHIVLILIAALSLGNQTARAEPPLRLHIGSLERITDERQGRSFLLVLWSLDCAPCRVELKHIKEAINTNRAPDIVLISTDTPDRSDKISAVLSGYGLSHLESWVFDDPIPERLRHEIDPQWYGELPRSYFYNKAHSRTSRSGTITLEKLARMSEER